MSENQKKSWRVYRFETPDGRYAELASNELAPEQIQLPRHAAEYRFVRATEMVPRDDLQAAEAEVERLREALERQFTPTAFGGFLHEPAELRDAVKLAAALAPSPDDRGGEQAVSALLKAALERVVVIYQDGSLTNAAAQDKSFGIASDVLEVVAAVGREDADDRKSRAERLARLQALQASGAADQSRETPDA